MTPGGAMAVALHWVTVTASPVLFPLYLQNHVFAMLLNRHRSLTRLPTPDGQWRLLRLDWALNCCHESLSAGLLTERCDLRLVLSIPDNGPDSAPPKPMGKVNGARHFRNIDGAAQVEIHDQLCSQPHKY